jgi:two-component system, OmpR family, sensor kinase
VSRIAIRWRLTIVFVVAMAVVLSLVGLVLYERLGSSITGQINDRLTARGDVVAGLIATEGLVDAAGDSSLRSEDAFIRVVDPAGRVVASTPGVGIPNAPVPSSNTPRFVELNVIEPDGDTEPARLRIGQVARPDGAYVVTIGESTSDRRDALRGLLTQLWLLGPIALVVASILGYLVSRAALRPVDEMRRMADQIGADATGPRLPIPGAADEVQRLATTLNAMLDRLDAGMRRERRFVADASHELRTPLALLQTELELAQRRSRTPQELEAAIDSAKQEVDRLARLAEDLLVLAAADEGRLPLRASQLDTGDLLHGIGRRFAQRAAAAGRDLRVGSVPGLVLVADRLRIEQALGNLVDNALRDGAGTVRVEADREGDAVLLRVADDGAGFADDLLPDVFERFARADGIRTNGAAGLGLSIVQAIATAHGGVAVASNRAEGGAQVVIRLPAEGPPKSAGEP